MEQRSGASKTGGSRRLRTLFEEAREAGPLQPELTAQVMPIVSVEIDQAQTRTRRTVMATHLLVSVVDDDESVRESLPDLLKELGYAAEAFSSAEEFLASGLVGRTRCLILDVAMPGMSGPELQRELTRRRQAPPIVFITASRDEAVRSRVLESGAVECLFKPFTEAALLSAIEAALGGR